VPPRPRSAAALLAGVLCGLPLSAPADDAPGRAEVHIDLPGADPWERIGDPVIREMLALDAIAPFEDLAPLWDWLDAGLQGQLDAALSRLQLHDDVRRGRLAVALVDVSAPGRTRVAEVNGDAMMYAASLPKIAVLLAAFEKIAQHQMALDAETRALMERMIRKSDNEATTELMGRVGKTYIARVLLSPRYRLYDPRRNGGLWVGKDYASAGLWKRDPLHNLSHGATAMQVARFYYLLWTDNLVTPHYSQLMQEVMSGQHLNHKFVKALTELSPDVALLRKSGSWRTFHSDSALVQHDGHTYIAVALSDDPNGSTWMQDIIVELDRIVVPREARKPPAPEPVKPKRSWWPLSRSDGTTR
jgi:beta-lactamase class A